MENTKNLTSHQVLSWILSSGGEKPFKQKKVSRKSYLAKIPISINSPVGETSRHTPLPFETHEFFITSAKNSSNKKKLHGHN